MEAKVLFFAELALGIIVGFVAWSYISPALSGVSAQPTT